MILKREQEDALSGRQGPPKRWAMEVLCRLADEHSSSRMVPVRSVHIPDWRANLGSEAWGHLASGVAVPTTANPGGPPNDRAAEERALLLEHLRPTRIYTCTCAPYLVGNHPPLGGVASWGGRAAGAFANSVLGVRSAQETFESAAAAAIIGATPERGLLIDENRRPSVAVTMNERIRNDHALLGLLVSGLVPGEVPLICGIAPGHDEAKRLAFSINHDGRMPLFRMSRNGPPPGLEQVELTSSAWADAVDAGEYDETDLVIMGCPHMSEQDINRWGRLMKGRGMPHAEAWFFTSRLCADKCPATSAVLKARGRLFTDMCPLTLISDLSQRSVACDSPGMATCLRRSGVKARYVAHRALQRILAPDR